MHLIPNLFTTGNLFCGVFAILSVFNANYMAAAIAISGRDDLRRAWTGSQPG